MAGLTVRAAVVERPGARAEVQEIELDAPTDGEVRIRVGAVGICHTDLAWAAGAFGGAFPGVAGHEVAGVIDEVGADVTSVAVGDHVVASVIRMCRACARCTGGEPALCERRDDQPVRMRLRGLALNQVFGMGGFADQAVVDASSVIVIPDSLPFPVAAVVGCAALTGYGAATRIARIPDGGRVAVFGAGAVGLVVAASALAAGAGDVVVMDPEAKRRSAALAFGARAAVEPGEVDALSPFDTVFEASGSPGATRAAIRAARRGGEVILIGLPPAGSTFELDQFSFVVEQKRLLGCNMGNAVPAEDVQAILALHASGALDLERLVTNVFALGRVDEAFAHALAGNGLRTVVVPN